MKGQSLKSKVQSPKSSDVCVSRLARRKTAASRSFFRLWTRDFGLWTSAAALSLLAPALSIAAAAPISSDDIPPLRPPHGELAPTFWEHYGIWVVIVGVLLLALVCGVAWRLTRPKPPVLVPPEVQARQALESLRQQPEDGALLSRVSQILRHYVTAAFDLPPEELTTGEFCAMIAAHSSTGPELSAALTAFLRECDQRKFSQSTPVAPFSATAQALKLIDQAQTRRLALAQPASQPTQSSVATPPKPGIQQ